MNDFNYDVAFSRNLGWITPEEQNLISKVRIGIAGLGGVGGQYCEVLARLGISNFVIADFDSFSIENTNRQNGCMTTNYGKQKSTVMANLIREINPLANVEEYPNGLTPESVEEFCSKIDIYIDGLDFYQIDLRILIFKKMKELNKYALTAAPIGAGTSALVFGDRSMSFENYFGFKDDDEEITKNMKFTVGLDPLLFSKYLKDISYFNLKEQKSPSLIMGVYSSATFIATLVLKIILGRGQVMSAPYLYQQDTYLFTSKIKKIWFGFKNPLQKLKLFILKKMLLKKNHKS